MLSNPTVVGRGWGFGGVGGWGAGRGREEAIGGRELELLPMPESGNRFFFFF